ncbi:MAG TPA: MFS transporter [Solirubrobacteraceae bacterium]|jgi:MFS family permease|nr:MFS transporter [Solirubrobacteraceae bacterium]
MRFRGPLADSYGAAALLVAFALIPYLALTSAIMPLQHVISGQVGLSAQALQNATGMANAGYAFGTLLAVQLAVRMRPRRLLLSYAALLVVGSVMTALAITPGMFVAGHVVQGLCTSLMLIGAVPPLVTRWPANRMPVTAAIMNLCIFGAVALGPVIGQIQAAADAWRPLFWLATGASTVALLLVLLTWEDDPAPEPRGNWDPVSLILAGGGCAAAFFGASELTTHRMLSVIVFLPLLAGAAAVAILVVHQAVARNPLVPVRELISTKPVVGVIAAMAAGAASVPAIELVEQAITGTGSPAHLGSLFWPFFGGALLTAVIFGLALRTRMLAAMVFIGLAILAGGIAVTTGVAHGPHSLVATGSGMIGIGVGAAVAPALFVAGYSVRAMYIQRVLALVELLRAVAAFLTAPILLHLALTTDGGPTRAGITTGLWICFAIAATGLLLSLYVFVLGRARLERPDIEKWQEGKEPAWNSPPLADGIRHETLERALLRR